MAYLSSYQVTDESGNTRYGDGPDRGFVVPTSTPEYKACKTKNIQDGRDWIFPDPCLSPAGLPYVPGAIDWGIPGADAADYLPGVTLPDTTVVSVPEVVDLVLLAGYQDKPVAQSALPLVALLASAVYAFTQRKSIMRSLKRSLVLSVLLVLTMSGATGCVTKGEFKDFVGAARAHDDAVKSTIAKANADPALPDQVRINRTHEASDWEGLLEEAEVRAGIRDAVAPIAPVVTK